MAFTHGQRLILLFLSAAMIVSLLYAFQNWRLRRQLERDLRIIDEFLEQQP